MKREWTQNDSDRMADALMEKAGVKFVSEAGAIEILQTRISAFKAALLEIEHGNFFTEGSLEHPWASEIARKTLKEGVKK